MDIITTAYGWEFLFRYVHFLAGITWIGVLYYFNFIQTPFFGTELGGQAKSAMIRGLVPNALWCREPAHGSRSAAGTALLLRRCAD